MIKLIVIFVWVKLMRQCIVLDVRKKFFMVNEKILRENIKDS